MTDTNELVESTTTTTTIEVAIAETDKSTTIPSSSTDMPPPKKRKKSSTNETPVRISAAPQTNVALPPPLMSYPHTHLVPSYYPVYQHPYFLTVGPQPPISPSLSPTLSSSANTATTTAPSTTTKSNNVRILPKSPTSTPSSQPAPSTPPTALQPSYIYPYAIQVSPQLHPSAPIPPPAPGSISPVPFHPMGMPVRHNSITSTTSTADEREQARKVSHSAIERRRRERINDKILQLRDLIPACSDRENLHKMTILQSAIDYIVYLKKVVDDLEGDKAESPKFIPNVQTQQTKSMLPKEVEPFTHQFSINKEDEEVEEEEETWSPKSIPSSSLKPMDVIQLNKSKKTTESPVSSPPKIVIGTPDNTSTSNADRNMNLENLLC